MSACIDEICEIVMSCLEGEEKVCTLDYNDNLFNFGMTSFQTVRLLMELESKYDIHFPEEMMRKEEFESIRVIYSNVHKLLTQ